MQKKSLLVALFFGALCLTGCLKNEESASVAQVRIAKAEELKAAAALKNAKAQAEVIYANAEAKLKEAQAALINAQAETEKVRAELLKVQVKLQEVKVDEERVVLQKMQAELEVLLAKAEAQKQFWVNELNNLLAQAEVDAVENAQKLIEAQADVEAYILKLEGEKADSAAVYSQKYFAALGEIEKLQIEEIKYKAMRALVNQGAVIAREVIYMEIEDNNEEIAKNEAIIAHLKEHQSWTPEQAEAALAAAREELEQAYTAYQDAIEFENTLEQTKTEVWNKAADFTYGWPNSFVNDLKALVPGVTRSGFDTEYGWFVETGYYDEEGEFVPLYNREQLGSVSERYPDVEVYAVGDFTVVHHPAILPATIYYDNIDELLASYTEAVADGAAEAVADFGDELEDQNEILEAVIDANEERLALHQKYVDARKETVEKAEKKFLNDLAAKESAEAAAAAAWDNFQEYWLVHYDASRQLVYDLYDAKTAYAAKKKVSDEKQIALSLKMGSIAGLKTAATEAKDAEAKAEGAYHVAQNKAKSEATTEVEDLNNALANYNPKFDASKAKKVGDKWVNEVKGGDNIIAAKAQADVLDQNEVVKEKKEAFDKAADDLVRHPKGSEEYAKYKKAYDDAEAAYDKAQEDYNTLVAAEGKAKTKYENAQKAYDEVFGPVETAKKAWDDAVKARAAAEKAVTDAEKDTKAGGKTYDEWKAADTETKDAEAVVTAKKAAMKAAIGKEEDTEATKLYEAYLAAADKAAKASASWFDLLKVYIKFNPDEIDELDEYPWENLYDNPRDAEFSWINSSFQVDYTATVYDADGEEVAIADLYPKIKSMGLEVTVVPPTSMDGKFDFDVEKVFYDEDGNEVEEAEAALVPNYFLSLSFENEFLQQIIDATPEFIAAAEDLATEFVKGVAEYAQEISENAQAYKAYEESYLAWVDERLEASEAVIEAEKDTFDAKKEYEDALAAYEATEAIVDEGMWVYDPTEQIEEAAFHQDGFAWIPINDTIEYFEGENEKLAFENKFYQNVLTDGKKVLTVVNEIIDQKLQVVSDNLEILATIAFKYRAIMNAYLGIVEGEGEGDEDVE
jgi:hypothetical protein